MFLVPWLFVIVIPVAIYDFTNQTWNLSNTNTKVVAYLIDKTKWTSYKTNNAKWVIGAPSLEIFIKSYNATHIKQIQYIADNTGYKVKWLTDNSFVYSVNDLGNTNSLDKAIFCKNGSQYFLATQNDAKVYYFPNSENICLYTLNGNGSINYAASSDSVGIRPFACVPLSLIETENGITITDSYGVE